jgi:hypothetical protein
MPVIFIAVSQQRKTSELFINESLRKTCRLRSTWTNPSVQHDFVRHSIPFEKPIILVAVSSPQPGDPVHQSMQDQY